MQAFLFLALGLGVGVLSGFFGIGGGIVMIPAMVLLFGLTQHQAQGTSLLAMIPPVGLLAAWEYWKHGNVKIGMGALICLGMFAGAFVGAYFAQLIPPALMKRVFGGLLLLVGIKMILGK
jgi:uncharacterized membrane protein YfcA